MKTIKFEKRYETPHGLEEYQYYKLMHEFVELVKVKGLTIRQAQKLFIDCADMILDIKLTNGENDEKDKISDADKIVNEIDKLTRTISGICLLHS